MTLGGDTHTTLTQEFWPQSHLTVVESDIMFFDNKDVHEEFAMNEHYVGLARNRPALSFRIGVDCHEGYMVLIRARDEEHPKSLWLVKILSSPYLFKLAPTFVKLKWNIAVLVPKTRTFSGPI